MILTIIILGFTIFFTFFYTSYIDKITNYKNKEVILNVWNIYASTILVILITKNIKLAMILCALKSILYNLYLYHYNLINKQFVKISIPLNILVIIDMLLLTNI